MKNFLSNLKGVIHFIFIIIELTIGFSTITIANLPRPFVSQNLKISLARMSNHISDWTILGFKVIMNFFHNNKMEVIYEDTFDRNDWCLGLANHQSWADILLILSASNYMMPNIRFFMKKELSWIPFIYLANKNLNMPFVNRHSKKQITKNPNLRLQDYENTIKSCKRLKRAPSTIFSYAEGTRFTPEKHKDQNSSYKNLLEPKIGGLATALSALPESKYLIDFTLIYKTDQRSAWAFLKGDMADVKILVKKFKIPESLKNKSYLDDNEYRIEFKNWIEDIWSQKDKSIESLKF
ncbi:MAG: acetyltransferase [Gammaproteobacteria bacterium]|mgnify:FL=1|tara:strand:+ start:31896 stop:32777 length:882 start_codon:yes stop_codon:yes gene_type:complete